MRKKLNEKKNTKAKRPSSFFLENWGSRKKSEYILWSLQLCSLWIYKNHYSINKFFLKLLHSFLYFSLATNYVNNLPQEFHVCVGLLFFFFFQIVFMWSYATFWFSWLFLNRVSGPTYQWDGYDWTILCCFWMSFWKNFDE